MTTEAQLEGWTGPSSDSEQDRQERTERMIKDAIDAHDAFDGYSFSVYVKGSYANQTNVRADSDVDVVVHCHEVEYWGAESATAHPDGPSYSGIWTPRNLRDEIVAALGAKFSNQVDTSGSTAIVVRSSSARVDADVVPSFSYRYYFNSGSTRVGTRTFRKNNSWLENYPAQHLAKGKSKDVATNTYFKQAVRILKRVENLMVANGVHREVPSYFVECLVYNCPNSVLLRASWIETLKGLLVHIWDQLQGDAEPEESKRWLEVNECKYLFNSAQKWSREDGRDFAHAAWNYLCFAS
jgi:hypothetical protein